MNFRVGRGGLFHRWNMRDRSPRAHQETGKLQMVDTTERRLLIPGLAGFYATWREIAYTLVRVIIGYIIFMHGWGKLTAPGLPALAAIWPS